MSYQRTSLLGLVPAVGAVFFLAAVAVQAGGPTGVNWPGFRGWRAKGIAEGYPTATAWNAAAGEKVKWKTPIEGLGHSSPVIWGDRIFVTSTAGDEVRPRLKVGLYGNVQSIEEPGVHRWVVYCLDKHTGEIIWRDVACEDEPRIKRHPKASHANSTPATDGRRLVAFFGSEGLYCYDMDGNLKWKKDLGTLDAGWYVSPEAQWGFGSSPIIYKKRVFIQCDVQKGSFVAAYDLEDGSEIWRTPRDEVPTWSTPTIYQKGKNVQLICNGYRHIGGYDVETGEEIWRLQGGGDIPVPTAVTGRGLVFIANAHGKMAPMYAISPRAKGDITLQGDATSNDHVAWCDTSCGAYMQTPLVYGDYLYACRDNGVLTCYRAKSGQRVYRERLGSGRTGFTASPVAANDKLYFTSEEGDVYVVQAGAEFKVLAENPLGEVCMATPAISEGVIFFRTRDHLVAIAKPKGKARKAGRSR